MMLTKYHGSVYLGLGENITGKIPSELGMLAKLGK
jgi:hypothetical protein